MNWIEALILGIIQGLTEFLPVSSSGHLEIGKYLLGVEYTENLTFTVVVHGATVLSTIIVFRKIILDLFKDLFKFKWNDSTKYITKIFLSMIPVGIVGVFFKDEVEKLFTGNILFVGIMLLITALILGFTYYSKNKEKEISYKDSIIIGIAQALAIIPGISRSGVTIATGLYLGNKKENVARFSFLMVLLPIIGANIVSVLGNDKISSAPINYTPLIIGFLAAFISGLIACSLMLRIVKNGKLIYFAIYCLIVGAIAVISAI
ncbi:MAG: undecaprenyl-diphosphate phosphatase [Bacteroidales bacterium]|jgi:undecaprenyl-diphosphatase|nr:undecaprenyl-diphosphate phosphatase [Bacteroidales bacterium]